MEGGNTHHCTDVDGMLDDKVRTQEYGVQMNVKTMLRARKMRIHVENDVVYRRR